MTRTVKTELFVASDIRGELDSLPVRALEDVLILSMGGMTKLHGVGMWVDNEDKNTREPSAVYVLVHGALTHELWAIREFVVRMKELLHQEAILRVDTEVEMELM